MRNPDLAALVQWIGPERLAALEERRKSRREYQRHRKLATRETLWLMLAVSLQTACSSLDEILRWAVADLPIEWSVSVPAFCQARRRFSPR